MLAPVMQVRGGRSGEIRADYQVAARLSSWSLVAGYEAIGDGIVGRVHGALAETHPLYIRQRPLTLAVHLDDTATWEWVVEDLAIEGHAVAVTVRGLPSIIRHGKQEGATTWDRSSVSSRPIVSVSR